MCDVKLKRLEVYPEKKRCNQDDRVVSSYYYGLHGDRSSPGSYAVARPTVFSFFSLSLSFLSLPSLFPVAYPSVIHRISFRYPNYRG